MSPNRAKWLQSADLVISHVFNLGHRTQHNVTTNTIVTHAFAYTCMLNSELKAILSYGHPPIPRWMGEGGFSVEYGLLHAICLTPTLGAMREGLRDVFYQRLCLHDSRVETNPG